MACSFGIYKLESVGAWKEVKLDTVIYTVEVFFYTALSLKQVLGNDPFGDRGSPTVHAMSNLDVEVLCLPCEKLACGSTKDLHGCSIDAINLQQPRAFLQTNHDTLFFVPGLLLLLPHCPKL
uniref:Uncharacterized protein n=1 Tax=Dunaliella tertiolecta TaxID=3047 RepID=A0A7S3R120_DUNTE|eukprot:426088-Pelagomonas_calceolata.AAC.2